MVDAQLDIIQMNLSLPLSVAAAFFLPPWERQSCRKDEEVVVTTSTRQRSHNKALFMPLENLKERKNQ